MVVLDAVGSALREGFFMFWETLWALILGFTLSGAVQAFVGRGEMERVLGGDDARSLGRATFLGTVSSSCSYAATAMAKSLFSKGANFTAALVFMIASTNLVIELGIVLALLIGWQFTASEFVGGLLMIALLAVVARFTLPRDAVAAARARLRAVGDDSEDGSLAGVDVRLPLRARLRSRGGWADAASYTMADLTMLRREMVIGFTVAGFLAVLVPDAVWSHVFITGHGFWTSLENVVVGPLIAILSFVCSIGNVPLAAALWKGGISFGGVVSFIFADLITLPLLAIYRRYYGTRLTVWILASFWLVMSVAGLLVEGLFSLLHLVPSTRPTQIAPTSFALNYTMVLNVLFIAAFAVLYWLHRNRERLGGSSGYARDVVCGMQVERSNAPARRRQQGATFHFCSDRCAERFATDPAAYTGAAVTAPRG
ncbi:MAG: permease [Candidatus Dormibacteria bacterium]